jgi:hypothetical protein
MRFVPFVVFFSVVIAIDGGVHYYLYERLFADPAWPDLVRAAGAIVLGLLAVLVPAGMAMSRLLPRRLVLAISYVIYIWMGAAFYLLVILFSLDVATGIIALAARGLDEVALARAGAVSASVATVGLTAIALRSACDVEVKEVEVALERLPKELSGLRIVQISDVHVGPTIGKGFVETIVREVDLLRPDAVVITGDLVDGGVAQLREHVRPIAGLTARFGVYFVTGNHDFYSGARPWIDELERLGIRVLANERVTLGDAASIDLAGVHDYASGISDVDRALGGRDPERELVLLAHQPRSILDAEPHRPGLVLSGHTHGGQLWPFDKVVSLAQPYVAGLHRHGEGSQIYVSRGTGYWGPPMRFLAPPEITQIVLTPR